MKCKMLLTDGLSWFIKVCIPARDMSQPPLVRAIISQGDFILLEIVKDFTHPFPQPKCLGVTTHNDVKRFLN